MKKKVLALLLAFVVGVAMIPSFAIAAMAEDIGKEPEFDANAFNLDIYDDENNMEPYNGGEPIKPEIFSYFTEGEDYTVTYENNINPGTAKVIISGLGEYKKCADIVKTFTIYKPELDDLGLFDYQMKSMVVFNKKYQKPTLKIIYNRYRGKSITLKEGTDYTLKYSKNKSRGTASVKITAKGQYTGSMVQNFDIVPKATKVKITAGKKSLKLKFTGKPSKLYATSYVIIYAIKGTGDVQYAQTKKDSITLKNLKKGKKYEIAVMSLYETKSVYVYNFSKTYTSAKVK